MNVKRNPEIKSIEEICKCIMVLWKGTADSLLNGAIKCGSTYCLAGPNKTNERKIVGFKRYQQGIGVKTEHKMSNARKMWDYFTTDIADDHNSVKHETHSLSAVKVMNESQYKIYKLEKDKKYWKKRYEDTQKKKK
eukprot:397057_1